MLRQIFIICVRRYHYYMSCIVSLFHSLARHDSSTITTSKSKTRSKQYKSNEIHHQKRAILYKRQTLQTNSDKNTVYFII